jgi:ribonuclease P protein component
VVRNRLRRRVREAVRLELGALGSEWWIVFNPRRRTLDCGFPELQAEIRRLFVRCSQTKPSLPPPASSSSPGTSV